MSYAHRFTPRLYAGRTARGDRDYRDLNLNLAAHPRAGARARLQRAVHEQPSPDRNGLDHVRAGEQGPVSPRRGHQGRRDTSEIYGLVTRWARLKPPEQIFGS